MIRHEKRPLVTQLNGFTIQTPLRPVILEENPGTTFRVTLVDDSVTDGASATSLPLLKTNDMTLVESVGQSFLATVDNDGDRIAFRRFDEKIAEILHDNSLELFGEHFALNEITDMIVPSMGSGKKIKLTTSTLNDVDSFLTFDPYKTIISNERFIPGVTFKAGLKPWSLHISKRTMKVRVQWSIVQVMILDEPVHPACFLEAEDPEIGGESVVIIESASPKNV